jgi:preprotein translocase subunit SecB
MADDDTKSRANGAPDRDDPATSGPGQEAPVFVVMGQYIKDLSFEAPGTPGVFAKLQSKTPQINVQVEVKAEPGQNNVFEVMVQINADAKIDSEVAYILELVYAGLFQINVPQEQLGPAILIESPRLLFPYARNIVSEVTRDGGFQPLMLAPMDFVALYQQRMQERAAQHQHSGPASPVPPPSGDGDA